MQGAWGRIAVESTIRHHEQVSNCLSMIKLTKCCPIGHNRQSDREIFPQCRQGPLQRRECKRPCRWRLARQRRAPPGLRSRPQPLQLRGQCGRRPAVPTVALPAVGSRTAPAVDGGTDAIVLAGDCCDSTVAYRTALITGRDCCCCCITVYIAPSQV